MNRRFIFLGVFPTAIFVFLGLMFMLASSPVGAIPVSGATPGFYVQNDDLQGRSASPPATATKWWLAATPTTAAGAYAIVGGEDRWKWRDINLKRCDGQCTIEDDYDSPEFFDWSAIDNYLNIVSTPEVGRKAIVAVALRGASKCEADRTYDGYTPLWITQSGQANYDYGEIIFTDPAPSGGDCVRLNWLNPNVKNAVDEFIHAMALKYDNDPRVAAIEIPSGAGGEALPWTHNYGPEISAYFQKWCPNGNCLSSYCPTHNENLQMCWAYDYMNWLIDTYAQYFHNKPLWIHSEGTTGGIEPYTGSKNELGARRDIAHWLLHAAAGGVGLATAGLQVQNVNGGNAGHQCAEYWYEDINLTPTPDSSTAIYFTSYHHFAKPFLDTVPISMEYRYFHDGIAPMVEYDQHDYMSALNGLSHGADYLLGFTTSILRLQDPVEAGFEVADVWEFINRFAGRKSNDAPGAWIAFNQTEENFQTQDGVVTSWWCMERPGDYQFLLRNVGLQWVKVNSTELGYIRIADSVNDKDCRYGESWSLPCSEHGSISTADKRGAIVRFLNPSAGRDAIYLDLDDNYRQRFGNEFAIKVTYWDDGSANINSAFRIHYNSTGGSDFVDVPKFSGEGQFRTFTTTLVNAALGNGLSATNNLNETVYYDIRIEDSDDLKDYLHMVFIEGISPPTTSTPTFTPTPTATPNPLPTPDFAEGMDGAAPGSFTYFHVENDAIHQVGSSDSWYCYEGDQNQNWPGCWADKYLPVADPDLTVESVLGMMSNRQTMTGITLYTPVGWGVLAYFDMSGYLHVLCSDSLCGGGQFDYITTTIFDTNRLYTLRLYASNNNGNGRIVVWVKPEGEQHFDEVYSQDALSFGSSDFIGFQIFSMFGINNGWYPEFATWDDAKAWWILHPTEDASPPSWTMHVQQLFAMSAPTETYQHGVNGYTGGVDTHIVTTSWESPTPHNTFPVLYLRTSRTEAEIKSSLIGFAGIDTSEVVSGTLSLYYSGQSVNGGDIMAHVAGMPRDWIPSETTWTQYRNGGSWQTAGAKGANDRWFPSQSRVVNYLEVGTWIDFDVTDMVRAGVYDFILYASSLGVNKDVQFASNEYWDVTKRPRLTIRYVEWGVP